MRVGIALHYRRHQRTGLALTLAALWRRRLGCAVTLFDRGRGRANAVDPAWDNRVQRRNYKAWAEACDHVVVPGERLDSALFAVATPVTVLHFWDAVQRADLPFYQHSTHVVCPSEAAHALFTDNLKLDRAVYIPWCSAQALHHCAPPLAPLRLLCPVDASVDPHWQQVVLQLRSAGYQVTVAVLDRTAASPDCAGYHLLVWLGQEATGALCLDALTAGVPVLAYGLPPASELLRAGYGGMLVPCTSRRNWFGVPQPTWATAAYTRAALGLMADQPKLARLAARTHASLEYRALCAVAGWQRLFSG